MKREYSRVFWKIYDAVREKNPRVVSNRGSARSTKTYSVLQFLDEIIPFDEPGDITSVVSETLPHLKKGAIRDFERIRGGDLKRLPMWSESEHTLTYPNGARLEFFSADAPGKVQGPQRKRLFINECNHIDYETYRQLAIRTSGTIYLDYNPTSEFWAMEKVETLPTTVLIHSTYKDNPFLTPAQVAEIESNKGDENWWRVYGLGLVGRNEGVIFDFDQVDEMPDPAGFVETYGIDFGFACFSGDTKVTTDKGQVAIRDIKAGDMVLTRQGYRKVVQRKFNGYKEISEKIIIFDNGNTARIAATPEHNFNINGKWKKYGKLEVGDALCMLSHLTDIPSNDTPQGNIQTITTASLSRMGCFTKRHFIGQFGRKPTDGKYQTGMTSITRISTPLTMISATCILSQNQSTKTSTRPSRSICGRTPTTSQGLPIQRRIGENVGRWLWHGCNKLRAFASTAARSLSRRMCISGFAPSIAIIGGNTPRPNLTLNLSARTAGKHLWGTSISNPRLAATSALTNSLSVKELREVSRRIEPVYDLWVDGVHEYFANGMLVHNCDPTAICHTLIDTGRKEVFFDELCYRRGMLNADIAAVLQSENVPLSGPMIFADCAEPKTIAELCLYGYNVLPCYKATRKAEQLQLMRGYKIHITKRSVNGIREARNYTWAKDKDGNPLNEPIAFNDHFMDCARYSLVSYLTEYRNAGQYAFGFGSDYSILA